MYPQDLQKVLGASYFHPTWKYASQRWDDCIHRLHFLVVLAPLFLLYRVIIRMVGGDHVLGLGSEEYTGHAHICARGKMRHLNFWKRT